MIKSSFTKIYLVGLLISVSLTINSQTEGFDEIRWKREKIASGLVWKSAHTVLRDSIPQNINMLIINLHKRRISLSYNPLKNIILSKQAETAEAIAAVNAGFFNIKDGGSVTYLRTGGLILDSDTARKWTRNSNMNGSLLIDKKGDVAIAAARTNKWYDDHTEFTEVLVTGPLLLAGSEKVKLPSTPLAINKHPRTAIGIVRNKRLIIITLDGRTDQAAGMTLDELPTC